MTGTATNAAGGLPVQLTSFVGREPQVLALTELLQAARLLTLTGPGGAGKTRLALEVAGLAAPRFEAVGWVDLAPIGDADLVAPAVATALGYRGEAGRLFLERARAVRPGFGLDNGNARSVAQICRRLDGIPLAIELAAARVRVLAPEQIASRLDHSFDLLAAPGRPAIPRHRTLREAIDWSHALLEEPEAALFRRLSVFAGSFSLDAVEMICPAPPVAPDEVLDLLSALVDKSLVLMEAAAGEARYRLLETLRTYARDRLAAADEESEFRRRHAAFFVELVTAGERMTFGGPSDAAWRARLIAEEGNLRAACDWAEETDAGVDAALQLCAGLHWHWFARGQFREARRRIDAALARAVGASALSRAKGLAAAATIAFWLGEHDGILGHASQAVALLRELDDPWQLAYALTTQGLGLGMTQPAAAGPMLVEATATARTQGRTVLLAFTLYWHGRTALAEGDDDEARLLFEECHELGREIRNGQATAHPLTMLGVLEVRRGGPEAAGAYLCESLRLHVQNSDVLGCIWALEGLARLEHRKGQSERAARLLAAALAERERLGAAWSEREKSGFEALTADLATRLGESFDAVWAAGRAMTLPDAVELGLREEPGPMPPATKTEPQPVAPVPPTPATPRLTVCALGALRIMRDGTPLEGEAGSAARARELLLFLLCHPGGRTRHQVGLAFWPEASTEQVRNNFHVTLHRLRKVLGGAHWVTMIGDRYTIDPAAVVEFDALRFEREARAGVAQLRTNGDAAPLAAALALYEGDFLEHESAGDWHLELRDRLRRLHHDALAALGQSWLDRERWQEGADVFRQLIARDELHEAAYRGLMTCHARLGQRSDVERLYRRLEQVLARELDAAPEAETAELRRRLLGAGIQ